MKNINFTMFGNRKFYDMFKPVIDTLWKVGAINWVIDLYLSNDVPRGFIHDADKALRMNLGGSALQVVDHDRLQVVFPQYLAKEFYWHPPTFCVNLNLG